MQSIFAKTFGGFRSGYYVRHFLFGLMFAVVVWFGMSTLPGGFFSKPGVLGLTILNSLLYPYSRFVYEGVVDYIIGRNVFFGEATIMLFMKWMTMFFCWFLAILIAPVGLAYLYWRNSRS